MIDRLYRGWFQYFGLVIAVRERPRGAHLSDDQRPARPHLERERPSASSRQSLHAKDCKLRRVHDVLGIDGIATYIYVVRAGYIYVHVLLATR